MFNIPQSQNYIDTSYQYERKFDVQSDAPSPVEYSTNLNSYFTGATKSLSDLLKEPKVYSDKVKRLTRHKALITATEESLDEYVDELIVKRADEDAEEYRRRRGLFTYFNLIGSAISELVNRFSTGNYTLTNRNAIYSKVYDVIDDAVRGKELLIDALSILLKYGHAYFVLEPINVPTIANRAQQELFISNIINSPDFKSKFRPISLYTPFECMTEGEGWYKFKIQKNIVDIDGQEFARIYLRYIDSQSYYLATYEYDGKSGYRLPGEARWRSHTEVEVPVQRYLSNYNEPVLKVSMDDLSIVDKLILQQKEYVRVLNSSIDAAHAASWAQKWYKPLDNDPKLPPKPGSERSASTSLMRVEQFGITERTGSALMAQMKMLEDIERRTKQLVSLSGLSFSSGASEQSGYSKEFEVMNLEASLRGFGNKLTTVYQKLLQQLGKALGDKDAAHLSVVGFDSFSLESAEGVANLMKLISDAGVVLPPTADKNLMLKLVSMLDPNAEESTMHQIAKELDERAAAKPTGLAIAQSKEVEVDAK